MTAREARLFTTSAQRLAEARRVWVGRCGRANQGGLLVGRPRPAAGGPVQAGPQANRPRPGHTS
jgi:hypothetical protein